MSIESWDTDQEEKIKLSSLLGWHTATAPLVGLLRLDYAASEKEVSIDGAKALQLALSAGQLRALGAQLIEIAAIIEVEQLKTAE